MHYELFPWPCDLISDCPSLLWKSKQCSFRGLRSLLFSLPPCCEMMMLHLRLTYNTFIDIGTYLHSPCSVRSRRHVR